MIPRIVFFALMAVPLLAQHNDQLNPRERHLQFGAPFAWPQTPAAQAPGTEVTRQQVLQLVKELFANAIVPVYNIDEFRFASLEKGKINLIVLGDATGRDFFDGVYAVYCTGKTCTCDITESDWPNDLAEQLIDPEGEGVYKVVTKHWVLGYEGARTKPIFTYSIERIKNGAKYSPVTGKLVTGPDFFDVTADYADYYTANLLPKIESAKKAVGGQQYRFEEDRAEAEAAAQFAYDDYRRRVLHNTKAGFDNALVWIGSPYRGIQRLAIRTMEETDDDTAASKLREWSQSKDTNIAGEAAPALSRWVQRRAERGR